MRTRSTARPCAIVTVRHSYENSLTVPASWALAQRIGYLYSEGEIIYSPIRHSNGYSIFNVKLVSANHDQLVTG